MEIATIGFTQSSAEHFFERLKRFADEQKGTLFVSEKLIKAIDEIHRYPLCETAVETLNRQLKAGVDDIGLAELVVALREENRLCLIHEEAQTQEPRIICSLGLFAPI